jgi:CheY-like chemotaxis protein
MQGMDYQILLVDRELVPAIEFQILSTVMHFDLVHLKNGLEALNWLSKGNLPDLIFADSCMDLIKAPKFVSTLKFNGFFAEIPIYAIGWPEELDVLNHMVKEGASQYFLKPLSITEIQDHLINDLVQSSVW